MNISRTNPVHCLVIIPISLLPSREWTCKTAHQLINFNQYFNDLIVNDLCSINNSKRKTIDNYLTLVTYITSTSKYELFIPEKVIKESSIDYKICPFVYLVTQDLVTHKRWTLLLPKINRSQWSLFHYQFWDLLKVYKFEKGFIFEIFVFGNSSNHHWWKYNKF